MRNEDKHYVAKYYSYTMPRDTKLILSDASQSNPIIVHVKNTVKMRKCMGLLGFSYDEKKPFKDNAKEFMIYLVTKKAMDLCEMYRSKDILEATERLAPRERYLLTFVKFEEIKTPKLSNSNRISFKTNDFYPGDYQYEKGKISPKWPTKTKKKELSNGKIIEIIIRRGVAYIENGKKSNVYVRIVGSHLEDSENTKRRYKDWFAVEGALMKYIKYYLFWSILGDTPEGRFVKALYRSTGVLK